jgi:hypothetical protein
MQPSITNPVYHSRPRGFELASWQYCFPNYGERPIEVAPPILRAIRSAKWTRWAGNHGRCLGQPGRPIEARHARSKILGGEHLL